MAAEENIYSRVAGALSPKEQVGLLSTGVVGMVNKVDSSPYGVVGQHLVVDALSMVLVEQDLTHTPASIDELLAVSTLDVW